MDSHESRAGITTRTEDVQFEEMETFAWVKRRWIGRTLERTAWGRPIDDGVHCEDQRKVETGVCGGGSGREPVACGQGSVDGVRTEKCSLGTEAGQPDRGHAGGRDVGVDAGA